MWGGEKAGVQQSSMKQIADLGTRDDLKGKVKAAIDIPDRAHVRRGGVVAFLMPS